MGTAPAEVVVCDTVAGGIPDFYLPQEKRPFQPPFLAHSWHGCAPFFVSKAWRNFNSLISGISFSPSRRLTMCPIFAFAVFFASDILFPFWVLNGSFAPTMRFEKSAIHQVFRTSQNFCWNKISRPKHQKVVFKGCLLWIRSFHSKMACRFRIIHSYFAFDTQWACCLQYREIPGWNGCEMHCWEMHCLKRWGYLRIDRRIS